MARANERRARGHLGEEQQAIALHLLHRVAVGASRIFEAPAAVQREVEQARAHARDDGGGSDEQGGVQVDDYRDEGEQPQVDERTGQRTSREADELLVYASRVADRREMRAGVVVLVDSLYGQHDQGYVAFGYRREEVHLVFVARARRRERQREKRSGDGA